MPKEHVEEWINAADGTPIYTKTWKSAIEPPVATVVFIHGFGEHINRYDHVFDKFSEVGIEVYGYDQRGFGKTAERNKNQGVTGGWAVATPDITAALIRKRREGIPQFMYGHSMGGGLTVNYACNGPERENLKGYLVTSPLLELAPETAKPEIFVRIGSLLAKVLPNFQISTPIESWKITHDENEQKKYDSDPLISPIATLRGTSDMVLLPRALFKGPYKNVNRPMFMAHGTGDQVTSQKASQAFYDLIPSKDHRYHYKPWEGLYHELHNEIEKDQVIQEYIDWLLARAKE